MRNSAEKFTFARVLECFFAPGPIIFLLLVLRRWMVLEASYVFGESGCGRFVLGRYTRQRMGGTGSWMVLAGLGMAGTSASSVAANSVSKCLSASDASGTCTWGTDDFQLDCKLGWSPES